MEIDSLITSIQVVIKEGSILGEGSRLYIFGSALFVSDPKDIDLLLEYDSILIGLDEIIKVRENLKQIIGNQLQKKIDMCLLSTVELASNPFIEEEGAKLIYG